MKDEEQQQPEQPVSAPLETQGSISSNTTSPADAPQASPVPSPEPPVASSEPVAPTVTEPVVSPQPAAPANPVSTPAPVAAAAVSGAYAVPKKGGSGLSIAALVCGILALVGCLLWFVSVPLGIAAIILGAFGVRKAGKGMGIAGIILGVLGIIATIAIYALVISYCVGNTTDEDCTDINEATAATALIKQL